MKIRLTSGGRLLMVLLFLCVSLPTASHAQVPNLPESNANLGDILGEIDDALRDALNATRGPANIEGGCIRLNGNTTRLPTGICEDVNVTSSGRLSIVPNLVYEPGDSIKCNLGSFDYSSYTCVLTKKDGSQQSYRNGTDGDLEEGGREIEQEDQDQAFAAVGRGDDGCSLESPGSWPNCLARGFAGIALTFATFLLGIAGILFNWVVLKTVFQFSTLIGNSPGLLAAWTILRDIGNMLLLFGFIFIGISMILDLHSYPAKKTLPFLIIFAVLMNFSLFAAEAIIDTANGLSSVVYNQASTDPCFSEDPDGGGEIGGLDEKGRGTQGCAINYGIAAHIMESTGIASIFRFDRSVFDISTTALLMTTILALIAAAVLFAAAIMLIFRAVILTFLMVTAPLGFAGMAIPPLQKAGRDWWHNLINQAFFAPVMLLLILVSLKITDSLATIGTRGNLMNALTTSNTGMMGVILVYALVIGFLLASLAAAKKFGAAGATFAVNVGTKAAFGGFALSSGLAFGGGARGLMRLQQKTGFGGSAGRFVVNRALRPLANANLDLRRIPGMGAALGFAGATEGAKAAEHSSYMDLQHQAGDIISRKRGKELDAEYNKEIANDKLVKELSAMEKDPTKTLSPDSERLLAGLSAEEIAANHDLQHSVEQLAGLLSADQFEGMMKSDKVDQDMKDKLRDARFGKLQNATFADRDAVRNLSNKELELLAKHDPGAFNSLISQTDPATGESILSNEQSEHLAKSSSLTNSQRSNARAQTRAGRIEAAVDIHNDPTQLYADRSAANRRAANFARDMSSKSKAKLAARALTHESVMSTLTSADLADIQREGKLSTDDIRKITAYVTDPVRNPNAVTIQNWLASTPQARGYWTV